MKKNQSSRSALGVACFRAIEAQKPVSERICYDPYARALIPGVIMYSLLKLMINSGFYERIAPGATAFIICRERYIDDFLKTSLREGFDQVVILGAGFDMRAYHIAGIEKTKVFEIDHPATQEDKLKRLKKVIDPLPDYVTFVSVDFNTQNLSDCLQSSGYNEQGKTLFIWQGVTYFLTQEGIDSTLSFIANHSGEGSTMIFDYCYNEMLRDTRHGYGKIMHQAARASGEKYMFGIDQGQIEPFMTKRGFHDIQNVTLEDLKPLYYTGSNAGRVVPKGIAIVSARVRKDRD